MKYLLTSIAILGCVACGSLKPQPKTSSTRPFPADWLGYWQGDLVIYTAKGAVDTLPMALNKKKISAGRWEWSIIYNRGVAGKEETRAYELIAVDSTKGHYRVDEKDGILLDSYLRGGNLYSRFDVMGSLLESVERMEGEKLVFEIFSGPQNPAMLFTSGDTIIGKDTVPPVRSYPLPVMQRAILSRSK